jgi:hypothetical protein
MSATTDQYYPVTNQLIKCSDGYFYAIADDGMEAGPYLAHAVESGGWLFLLTDPGLKRYPSSDFFTAMARAASGKVFLATADGLRAIDPISQIILSRSLQGGGSRRTSAL